MSSLRATLSGASGFLSYAASLAVMAGLTLLSIPALIVSAGETGWAAIAIGQSVGILASVVVLFGWGFDGPVRIARVGDDWGWVRQEFHDSLRVRFTLVALSAPVACGLASVLASDAPLLASAGTLSTLLIGMRCHWIFIGVRKPNQLFLVETLPRAIALILSIVLLLAWPGSTLLSLLVQAAGVPMSILVCVLWLRARSTSRLQRPPLMSLLRRNSAGVLSLTAAALWAALPPIVVSVFAPSAMPAFALVARVQAQANTATSPLIDLIQGWIPATQRAETVRRATSALVISGLLALAGMIAYALLANPLFVFLGAGIVSIPTSLIWLSAASIGVWLVVQCLVRGAFAALGLVHQLFWMTLCGAVVGVVLLGLVPFIGADGAYIAILGSSIVQLCFGLSAFIKARRLRS